MKKTKAKKQKILVIFIVLILLISTSAFLYASSIIEDPVEIVFQDKNLYNAVKLHFQSKRLKYYLNEGTLTITASEAELNLIEELDLTGSEGAKIVNAEGLQSFINLKKIILANNSIKDITPITQLNNLISIDFSNNANINLYNKSSDICYLPNQGNLEELYIGSTNNSEIKFVNKLPKLKALNISNNGVSELESLKSLSNLQKLDVSNNTSITKIDDILSIKQLTELNIASTGITSLLHSNYESGVYEHGIYELTYLENLNVENNKLSIEPVYRRYINANDQEEVYLKKLKKLNFNYTGQNYLDFWALSMLQSLTHLDMKGNGINYISDSIATLQNLEYINLAENDISDISGFIKYSYEGGIEARLSAKQIRLEHNKIEDISPLSKLDHDITYLNLSSNRIFSTVNHIDFGRFSFSEGLDLTRQGRDKLDYEGNEERWGMKIKRKTAKINQYIILPTLFQNSKNAESVIYTENLTFTTENIELNPGEKYQTPGNYNVIIPPPEEEQQKYFSITINGGRADGSILYFEYVDDPYSVDSLIFEDPNLAEAIENELREANQDNQYYVANAEDILNIENILIAQTNRLHLENHNISSLSGLASFENLTHVYLSNNDIPSIDELRYCTQMSELYVSNNPRLGDNNSAIEEMMWLSKLDLSNTGMTNIQSLQNLIRKCEENYNYTLTILNISNNSIGSIQDIGKMTSLEELYISNIGINDILEVRSLTNLKTLNASGNNIKTINSLQGLSKLKYLTISNNEIEDITPIARISLDNLDFSNNKVKDVSSLTRGYTSINMDTNKIEDISNFNGKLIATFSVKNQKMIYAINNNESEELIIPLPKIFLDSKDSTSKVYTSNNFIMTKCDLSSDGNSVVVNPTDLGNDIATVMIYGGNADRTTFSIAAPLKGTINYNPGNETPTNQDVVATITFDTTRDVTITNNEGNNTYTFTENGTFDFEYEDEYGFTGKETATVENIDKIKPEGEITQEIVDKKVVVTIETSEPVVQPEGWEISSANRLILTKTYEQDANETVILVDEAGNTNQLNIEVKIDTTAPVITGVENGQTYNGTVTPVIEDENTVTVILKKDETIVENYQAGTRITEPGQYVLEVTDAFENKTTVTFTIEIDTTAPTITGVENGTTYNESVTPVIEDENLATVVLKKDGVVIENYQSGTAITESGEYILEATDEFENKTTVTFTIYIDTTAPTITGVENGQTYNESVTPVIEDENLSTVVLKKDGEVVENYQSGTTITEPGQYTLEVTDTFENKTTVSFKIEISDKITSEEATVIEGEGENAPIIKDINPNTTINDLKNKIQSQMEYEIIDKNGDVVSETAFVGTGCKIKMTNEKTYTIIISGDVDGDGKAEIKDILAINKHRLRKSNLTGEYLVAGDVNRDGNVELRDILQINKFRLGKINEL